MGRENGAVGGGRPGQEFARPRGRQGFRGWARQGNCDLFNGGEWALNVDATVVRAHHHSAGARRPSQKDIPASVLAPAVLDQAMGRNSHGRDIE